MSMRSSSFISRNNVPPPPEEGALAGSEIVRCIKSPCDMLCWETSELYTDILQFINGVCVAINGKRNNDNIHLRSGICKLLEIFVELHKMIDEVPPVDQPLCLRNKAFRQWYHRLQCCILHMFHESFPQCKPQYLREICVYLSESFGNATRIDYGIVHELSFAFFMCALIKADILNDDDQEACGLRLFNAYLMFVRRLQTVYRMQLSGSQGVWSLNDYQILSFIWGSAQLSGRSPPFVPAQLHDDNIIQKYKDDYMFIGCLDYISKVKPDYFYAENSNNQWRCIKDAATWPEVNKYLIEMYQKEVLGKYSVMQRALFGQLMSMKPKKTEIETETERVAVASSVEEVEAVASDIQTLNLSSSLATTTTRPKETNQIVAEEHVERAEEHVDVDENFKGGRNDDDDDVAFKEFQESNI